MRPVWKRWKGLSSQAAVTISFTPWGADRRQKYLDCFVQGAWRWAQTPRLDVENWLTIQNWDIYRHLWAGYERCYATEYSWLWQAGGDRSMDIEAEVSARASWGGNVGRSRSKPPAQKILRRTC